MRSIWADTSLRLRPYLRVATALALTISSTLPAWASENHAATSTWAENRAQHQRLPVDDIWWTVNGNDMLWNFKNLHQIFPTVNVYRDGQISALEYAPDKRIDSFLVDTLDGEVPFGQFVESDQSTTMGVVILHKGRVVFERYPRMQPFEMPIYWSVAKVFPGLLVRLLEERQIIDVEKPIDHYIPKLANSALAETTVRNLLDMASGLDCGDEYENRESCYYQYSIAIGDGHWQEGDPEDPYAFLETLKASRHAQQGRQFSYSGVNTFVLSWLVEEVTGLSFQDAFTEEVWRHIGAEANGSFIAPNNGVAVTHGGFLSRLRDLARFGLLYTPSYKLVSAKQIITPDHLELLLHGGNSDLLKEAGAAMPDVRHNVYQWDSVTIHDTLYKGGWAGQGLIVNPTWDVVAVFSGYFKDDQYSETPLQPRLMQVLQGVYGSQD